MIAREEFPGTGFALAFMAEERGELAEAAALYEQEAATVAPGTIPWCQSLYRCAYCLERLGTPGAEAMYLNVVEHCPGEDHLVAECYFRLGWLREQVGDRAAAAGWYGRIPTCPGATAAVRANGAFRLAVCREVDGDLADAIDLYRQVVMSPGSEGALRSEAAYRLAELQESVGLLIEARDTWQLIERGTETRAEIRARSRYRLGLLLMAMDDDAVLELWADRSEFEAGEAGAARKAALALGCYLQRRQRYDQAEAILREAAAEDDPSPMAAEVLFRRLHCLGKAGRDAEARGLLDRLRQHPDPPPHVRAWLDELPRPKRARGGWGTRLRASTPTR